MHHLAKKSSVRNQVSKGIFKVSSSFRQVPSSETKTTGTHLSLSKIWPYNLLQEPKRTRTAAWDRWDNIIIVIIFHSFRKIEATNKSHNCKVLQDFRVKPLTNHFRRKVMSVQAMDHKSKVSFGKGLVWEKNNGATDCFCIVYVKFLLWFLLQHWP